MFCYKVKVSINENCEKYPKYEMKLKHYIKAFKLTSLGNDEYGTDDFAIGIGLVCFLGRSDWFIDNAKELLWFNGERYKSEGKYDIENSLAYYLNKRVKNFE